MIKLRTAVTGALLLGTLTITSAVVAEALTSAPVEPAGTVTQAPTIPSVVTSSAVDSPTVTTTAPPAIGSPLVQPPAVPTITTTQEPTVDDPRSPDDPNRRAGNPYYPFDPEHPAANLAPKPPFTPVTGVAPEVAPPVSTKAEPTSTQNG